MGQERGAGNKDEHPPVAILLESLLFEIQLNHPGGPIDRSFCCPCLFSSP
jgi:hypothetical protein